MIQAAATRSTWDERLARAAELSEKYPFAAEALRFYRDVASFQQGLYAWLEEIKYAAAENALQLPKQLDLRVLLPKFRPFVQYLRNHCRAELSASLSAFDDLGMNKTAELLMNFWHGPKIGDMAAVEQFAARAFLQPVAQFLAEKSACDRGPNYAGPLCPFCGRKPSGGALRPEGDGARRSLVCSFCTTEWQFRRVLCPACGETDLAKLPVYVADEFELLRVEACDSCRTFIKTVDLTKSGRANPIVDEISAIPLNLWAQENGYTKLETNLMSL